MPRLLEDTRMPRYGARRSEAVVVRECPAEEGVRLPEGGSGVLLKMVREKMRKPGHGGSPFNGWRQKRRPTEWA